MLVEAAEVLMELTVVEQVVQVVVVTQVYLPDLELLIQVAAVVEVMLEAHVVQAVPAVQELLLLKKLQYVV